MRHLKQQRLDLPNRLVSREGYGSLVWNTPTLSAVVRILHNPAYAGAYVYGFAGTMAEIGTPQRPQRCCRI